ncbi:MAG: aminotransferase class I/II-fold pyridoxal phosphate-dependent enzyme, partial [Actinobacteria bacterium]|nr:aminotransferase class I/II-fold pyridoxal phosphate-dependent enzyme [Actinomycetota bacterium]
MIGTSRATSSLALFDGPRALDVACLGIGARVERERDALARAIARAAADSGYLHSFVPDAVLELEEAFASAVGARHALGLASGTAALHVALAVCGVRAGDEVVTTPYTWPQVISPILDRLAVPVFADIDPDTYTLAPTSIEAAITERTRAILAVHQFGHAADMTRIREIARSQNLRIIEDAAQAFGATWNGSPVGIHGDVACFSLGLTKLVSGLEGGVLVTNDT